MLRIQAILIFVMLTIPITRAGSEERVLAEGQLEVVPAELTIVPSEISMQVGTPKRIQTVFCKRRVSPEPGMVVIGVLRASSLSDPLVLRTAPGKPFTIPALPVPGTYVLEDIHVEMDGVTFLRAVPDRVTIHVSAARGIGGRAGTVDGSMAPER